MKKGEGCKHLYYFLIGGHTGAPFTDGKRNPPRKWRCCAKRAGFMLKMWRCLGKDSPQCPGYVANRNSIEVAETK